MKRFYFPLITEEETRLPFLLKGVGLQGEQEHIKRPEGHPEYHWIHTTKGKGRLFINNKEFIISENMGFFIYPGVPHEYYSIEDPWETHWITFSGTALPELLKQVQLAESTVFYLEDKHLIEESFQQILGATSSEKHFNGFQTSVYLYQFLILCRSCICSNNRSVLSKEKQLEPVIAFIEKNYFRNPVLEEMAAIISVTPHHLCRLFKEVYKMRPFVYLTKVRLQKVKELILQSDNITIKKAAEEVGYNDLSYFCSVFKEYEGITPTEFRKIHRKE